MVFIGKNSSGKSNLLDALPLVFTDFRTTLEEDAGGINEYLFFGHDATSNNPCEIAIGLSLELSEWRELLGFDETLVDAVIPQKLELVKRLVPQGNNMIWQTFRVKLDDVEVISDAEYQRDQIDLDAADDVTYTVATATFLAQLAPFLQRNFAVVRTTDESQPARNRLAERPTIMDATQVSTLWQVSQARGNQRRPWSRIARTYERHGPNEGVTCCLQGATRLYSYPGDTLTAYSSESFKRSVRTKK